MKKNPLLLLVIGVALLVVGAWMSLGSGPPKAGSAMVAQCQQRLRGESAEMLAQCQERAFAAGMTATDRNEAARTISAANNQEIGGNTLGMFLMGLGLVFALFGAIAWRQRMR
jgi:type II secretory pathway component PulM